MATKKKTKQDPLRPPATWSSPLGNAYRRWGYLKANIDSLGRLSPQEHPDITDAREGASELDISHWEKTYCGSIGAEFMHIADRERARWVASWLEAAHDPPDQAKILSQLLNSESFERFLHTRYVGSKRYSIEGIAGVITLLEAIFDGFAGEGGEFVIIAMSHRGRLNVMANIVGIPAADLFAGMEDVDPKSFLGSGDVKYHLGATGHHHTANGTTLGIHLVSNPSHLEAVDPVTMGRVRAKQDRAGAAGKNKYLSVNLHGDAAFAGQGITSETLNFADLPGYTIGGTIHIVVNNLIGFTADYELLHSSRFSSDAAKRLAIPILHVNGEDPEALALAGQFATEYRATFGDDVVIDIVGYRRYGHSEVEDPSTTQPVLYQKIQDRPMLYEMYAERNSVTKDELETMKSQAWEQLEKAQQEGRARRDTPIMRELPAYWDDYEGGFYAPVRVETGVAMDRLKEIAARLSVFPDGFTPHAKVSRLLEQRSSMVDGQRPVDWGTAESLAFGSLLWEGTPVRLAGEDSRRGTFNQRHAVIIDYKTGGTHTPLMQLNQEQGLFTIVDTPLSEAAALGFEYGYSRDYPDALVCWEAQFGDFANGAQTIIDQFITAGEDKWGLLSGIVLLLPHGFEGQGPEHSSARLERFLQLAAEDNMQICQPSTSGQYFHLLRRQALQRWRKPLVVMTPKSLLRNPAASSPVASFVEGSFEALSWDDGFQGADRMIVCSGKIAHELTKEREKRADARTAIVSLEQLYPFPKAAFEEVLRAHPSAQKIVWVQEEPANMGALSYVRPILQRIVGNRHITTVKRSESASPATGSSKAHALEQQALIKLAFA